MHVLQAALVLAKLDPALVGKPIHEERLFDCVNVILSYQNAGGGWATYENTRSYAFLEVSLHNSLWRPLATHMCTLCCLLWTKLARSCGDMSIQQHKLSCWLAATLCTLCKHFEAGILIPDLPKTLRHPWVAVSSCTGLRC